MLVEIESSSHGKKRFKLRDGWRVAYSNWHIFFINPDFPPQVHAFGAVENDSLMPHLEEDSAFELKPYGLNNA